MKYLVTITKTMEYTIELNATDEESACKKAERLWLKDPCDFEECGEGVDIMADEI